jgi:hypothetical protein
VDKWTVEAVETRLEDAAQVISRLPPVRVPGYFNTWPAMFVEFADLVGREPERMRLPPPSTSAITRMEESLDWLRWLAPDDVKLVWARADRKPWKAICCQSGVSRAAANRRYQYALNLIAGRLNGRIVPAKWSRHFTADRIRTSFEKGAALRSELKTRAEHLKASQANSYRHKIFAETSKGETDAV